MSSRRSSSRLLDITKALLQAAEPELAPAANIIDLIPDLESRLRRAEEDGDLEEAARIRAQIEEARSR